MLGSDYQQRVTFSSMSNIYVNLVYSSLINQKNFNVEESKYFTDIKLRKYNFIFPQLVLNFMY